VATQAFVARLPSAHLRRPGDGRFRWKHALPSALLLVAGLLLACASPAPAGGGLSAIDDAGDTVRLAVPARRIVSLSPFTTELIFAIGAGDRLVGRTHWCDWPVEAHAVPDVGDAMPPNAEAVLARAPDLVLLYRSAQNEAAAARFRAAGVAVFVAEMDHLADVSRLARILGPLVERTATADSLAVAYEQALAAATVPDSGPRPSVLILAWDQPPIAIGAGSFQSELLQRAGGRNLFADLAAPSGPVSLEAIASRDPDVILVSDSGMPGFSRRPEWQAVRAVRERHFLHLADPAFGRPSPRSPEVLRALAALIRGITR